MMSSSRRPRFLYALLAVPLLLGAKDGKGCCGKTPPPDTHVDTPPPPTPVQLQVVSIDPSMGTPATAFSAKLYGSAFEDGAKVSFNDIPAASVTFVDANTLKVGVPGLDAGMYDVKVTNPDGKSSTMRHGLTIKSAIGDCVSVTVNFEFDSANLNSSAKSTLDSKMSCYQAATGKITVEGNADERGTTEYNLALGERRANTVKNYLTGGGIAAGRVSTVSFGEERPVARGHDESAWAANRRADLSVQE
jgi:peptidoglycan-associated lipoprotein